MSALTPDLIATFSGVIAELACPDIRGILAETAIEQDYLDRWLEQLGLHREWEQV